MGGRGLADGRGKELCGGAEMARGDELDEGGRLPLQLNECNTCEDVFLLETCTNVGSCIQLHPNNHPQVKKVYDENI